LQPPHAELDVDDGKLRCFVKLLGRSHAACQWVTRAAIQANSSSNTLTTAFTAAMRTGFELVPLVRGLYKPRSVRFELSFLDAKWVLSSGGPPATP